MDKTTFEKEAEDYMYSKIGVYKKSDTQEILLSFKDGAEFGYNKANEWHNIDEELIPTDSNWDNEFVVRLKNGNKRIVYLSCGILKDCVNGEHIPLDVIKLWLELPKEN